MHLLQHNRYVSETKKSEPDIVFIGDSIIQGLLFSTLWSEKISSLHCLNFGIGGDRVQNVLWRLQNGEMDFNVRIKCVVLFVGTNNTVEDEPEDIFEGIVECIKTIKNKLGDVHVVLPVCCLYDYVRVLIIIVLQTLLPRGQHPNILRDKNNAVNKLMIEKLEQNANLEWNNIHIVRIHENVLQSDNSLSHYVMYDYLHLSDAGYSKIFTPVYDKLCEIVQK